MVWHYDPIARLPRRFVDPAPPIFQQVRDEIYGCRAELVRALHILDQAKETLK